MHRWREYISPQSDNVLVNVNLPDSEVFQTTSSVAPKLNPVTYVMEAMRAMTLEGWEWETIFTGVWVAGVMLAVLLVTTTWMYRRQTA